MPVPTPHPLLKHQEIYGKLNSLIMDLRTSTPLGRINIHEAVDVFARIEALGWKLTPPATGKV